MSAFVVTLVAAEGLLPTMLQRVLFEDTSCCAGELTLHASKKASLLNVSASVS